MFLFVEIWVGALAAIRQHWLTLLTAGLISWLAQWLFPFLLGAVWPRPDDGLRSGQFGSYELWLVVQNGGYWFIWLFVPLMTATLHLREYAKARVDASSVHSFRTLLLRVSMLSFGFALVGAAGQALILLWSHDLHHLPDWVIQFKWLIVTWLPIWLFFSLLGCSAGLTVRTASGHEKRFFSLAWKIGEPVRIPLLAFGFSLVMLIYWFPVALNVLNQMLGYKLSSYYFTWIYSVFPVMVESAVMISIWYKLPGFQNRDQADLTARKLRQTGGV